ncbi:MAG TPA: hypothetical protein VIH57_22360, partial [Bacteroidales bacterium]
MYHKRLIIHAIFSGIMLALPFYEHFSGLILGIALVPLLMAEEFLLLNVPEKSNRLVFLYASLSFLTWNTGATWWIVNASLAGACAAILINTFLMAVVFSLYHITRKIAGNMFGVIAFVCYWTAFEYFYLNTEISWPWLNLGNGFAHNIKLIQWYEFTGTLGGTAWVLILNLLLFDLIRRVQNRNKFRSLSVPLAMTVLILVIPMIISLARYDAYKEKNDPVNVLVIQPDINPYDNSIRAVQLCTNLIHLADSAAKTSFSYFVAPEVAIDDNVWENAMNDNYSIPVIRNFIHRYPASRFVLGSYTYKKYNEQEPITATAQWMKSPGFYFDSYNTALQIDTGKQIQKYHKSKLVVGVEKMPYPKALKFLKKIMEGLGG